MKQVLPYICTFFIGIGTLQAQDARPTSVKLSFQDSILVVLENSRNVDAVAVGGGFASVWGKLGLDQQQTIKRQSQLMKKKGYKLRPQFVNYYGAISNAINREGADASKISEFLSVTDEVIENEDATKAGIFFKNVRQFFEYHALHYDRSFRLYARDDEYHFEYKKVETFPSLGGFDTNDQNDNFNNDLNNVDSNQDNFDGNSDQDQFDQWDNQDTQQDFNWDDEPEEAPMEPTMPIWMQPAPQPELGGPILRFDKVTFNFTTPYDSAFLTDTKGSLSLLDNTFVGEGGRFDWTPAGLGKDSVFFDFTQYNFNVSKPEVKAEQGKLTYLGKVSERVDGIFEFKSVSHKTPETSSYPRFMSFNSNIEMLGLGDDKMKYTGGFGLNGRKIYSSSVNGEPAKLEVFGDTDKKFEARSRLFEFQDSVISSRRAMVKIYQQNDSIYHPANQFYYDFGKRELVLQKESGYLKNAPYSTSYFNIDFGADKIRWDLDADSLNIYSFGGRSQSPMVLESVDYYDPEDFRLLAGYGFKFHPLALVASYALRNGIYEFYVDDLATATGQRSDGMRMAMSFLAQKGMIDYNASTGYVKVKNKALHYYDASKGEADYDNLKIHSIVDGPANATINFADGRMNVRGVEEFNVSDSLNVVIKPDSSVITLMQNRDIKFDGKITAGNFEINGKDFLLKYDSFFINLNHIDSIRFYITETNARGQSIRRRVNNAMVGADSTAAAAAGMQNTSKTSGTLFISRPDNKSGREKIPNYPRLDATAGGVIYFNRKEVLNGAYDRSVFFVVPPFKLDSLNDADPGSINFEGTFVSSGMFPNFKEKLHTMADKSLGFTHRIPDSGYQLFQGDGKIVGAMSLDNAGIRATGRIDYLAASVESNDFVFYPDSVVGRGNVGQLTEKQFGSVWYPEVTLTEFKLNWLPKQDKFNLSNLRDPFNLYQSTAQLDGRLTVSKTGVSGGGKLITRGSEAVSEQLSFSATDFGARHADFQVKTTNPDKPALAGDDVRLKFNLEQNYADISPEIAGEAALEFPYAQFKTSIPEARWDLNTQKIVMTKDPDVPLENSYFYTTREELDSLNFNAEKAEYDIQTQQLRVSGIPYIVVADARITPQNNEILILENAKIGQLKNTTIVMDTLNAYHRLTEGVVDIVSRKEFSGYATYQYVNAVNDTFAIKMTDFHLEPITEQSKSKKHSSELEATEQTVANGAVTEKENIILAPRIFYKGDMVMYATRPALQLNGSVKLDLKKIKNYNTWIQYSQSGDEKEVYIDFDNAVTEEGRKVEAGLHFADDNSLYITFVFDKKNPDDDDFFLPSGSLFFDKESGEFKIEDRLKSTGEKLTGKVFAYNEDKQEVRFEGKVNFFEERGKDFRVTATALGSGNLETNDIRMNTFLMLDMNVPSQALQIMALDLQNVIKNEGAEEGLGDQTELLYKIADIVGERAVKDFEQKSLQAYTPLITIPELGRPLVFSNFNLKRSKEYKAFYSEGKLGVSNILRNDINGAFEGFMELRKNEDGSPVYHVFFKASPDSWYYFGMEDNRLMMHSSNPEFNSTVAKRTNAAKAKIGELVFIPGSDEETLSWINNFRRKYYGLEAPYSLGAGTGTDKKKKDDVEDDGF
ncbi:MAG TPA: hypothetical protein PKJ63_06225 [Cyclobacteriaceae bacterium]|nr:hypothetical protein [Cyclobacteriaceae bacterium]